MHRTAIFVCEVLCLSVRLYLHNVRGGGDRVAEDGCDCDVCGAVLAAPKGGFLVFVLLYFTCVVCSTADQTTKYLVDKTKGGKRCVFFFHGN